MKILLQTVAVAVASMRGTFAMQSVSRLLAEQLNQLTQNLVQGVDINFDLATTQDYTTGTEQDRTI